MLDRTFPALFVTVLVALGPISCAATHEEPPAPPSAPVDPAAFSQPPRPPAPDVDLSADLDGGNLWADSAPPAATSDAGALAASDSAGDAGMRAPAGGKKKGR